LNRLKLTVGYCLLVHVFYIILIQLGEGEHSAVSRQPCRLRVLDTDR